MKVTDHSSSRAFTVRHQNPRAELGFFVPSCPETFYLPPPSATTRCSTLHRGLQRIPGDIFHLKNKFPALEIKHICSLFRRLVKPSTLIPLCQVQNSSSFTHLTAWLLADTEAKPKSKHRTDLPRRVWSTGDSWAMEGTQGCTHGTGGGHTDRQHSISIV